MQKLSRIPWKLLKIIGATRQQSSCWLASIQICLTVCTTHVLLFYYWFLWSVALLQQSTGQITKSLASVCHRSYSRNCIRFWRNFAQRFGGRKVRMLSLEVKIRWLVPQFCPNIMMITTMTPETSLILRDLFPICYARCFFVLFRFFCSVSCGRPSWSVHYADCIL